MNLTEINHKININPEHSVSSNKRLKNYLNTKNFNMFLTLWRGAVVQLQCLQRSKCEFSFNRKLKRTFIISNINRNIF